MAKLANKKTIIAALVVIAILFPLITQNDYFIHVLTLSFIWMIGVYGINILAGYTGYLSLAHAGFFAIGAYSLGLLTVKAEMNFWLALALSLVITAVIGFLVGLISLKSKEHAFSIYTMCVGYIIYLVIDKWESLTEGVRGLIGIPAPANIGPLSFETQTSHYYLILFFLLLTVFIMYRIVHSLSGRTYIAIRNSEDLAQTIGISTTRNKLIVFVISTIFAGLAGALYASFVRFIGPDIGSTVVVFDFLTYLMVGGIGTLSGPIVGTILIVVLSQQLQFLQDYRMLIFGPLLTLLIIFYPSGIVGAISNFIQKRKAKRTVQGRDLSIVKAGPITEKQVKEG
jgi:branched-chain amino acid transport system permease protein